jgi:LacI family transcriptional regulator
MTNVDDSGELTSSSATPTNGRARNGKRTPSATIYDIARETGLNASTVSRALNVPGRINAKTEKRVRDAASALGYRFNPMARALPTGRTSTLALLLSDITNPVYFPLMRGAEHVSTAASQTLVVADAHESPEVELATAERLQTSVDGIVLVASRLTDDMIRGLADTKPVILVNRLVPDVAAVVPDITPGIREALEHLAALGHTSVAFLSGPTPSWMSHHRWDVLLDEAPRHGLSIVEIGPFSPTLEGGQDAFRRVRAAGVSAVVAYNDLMAIGLLRACTADGVQVPQDLSIIGFDDIFGSDFTTPAITTVRTPLGEVGEEAVRRLLNDVRGLPDDESPSLSTTLVIRGSTAPPSA